ncbi:acetate/propionate family kinase [Legionella waltersii]|uniref:Acetate kinase n=1 Tax=Legionella waltersii TaxID=66969 RepID=A0A0W1AMU0_9GAMM|nr:acetate/propionate family kinase [Legionella waltersii]KTD82669.1 acetate kinase [Legionella waltersii]SNU95509.1 Acetate kinase (Acetokinase) [Legionella waltersii]
MIHETKGGILVINTGSSSVKFQVFSIEPMLKLLARGKVNNLGSTPLFTATDETRASQGQHVDKTELPADSTHENALHFILRWIETQNQNWQVSTVAHRIVHGGEHFKTSVRVNSEVMAQLWKLCPLAPLHQSHNLAAIKIISSLNPDLMQIACFDTAFHANHEPLFTEYALPQTMRDQGIRRYGFHGLSYEWIAHALRQNEPTLAKGRIIAAHLGNGASLCAMNNGISIDTTMGMTALDGLPMGTRCGNLDPGAVIYMIRELGLSPEAAESILYHESGLKGLSDWTYDVRLLQDSNEPKARFALDYFCMKTAQLMGMMAVALGGVDGMVFTGGIGENSSLIRDKILGQLAFLKPFESCVIPANEERVMAMHTLSILESNKENNK